MTNKRELRALMSLFGDRQMDLAAVLDMSAATLSNKINGKAYFNTHEIETIADRYKLTTKDIPRIFFIHEVATKATNSEKSD